MSESVTRSESFTIANAKELASKLVADLSGCKYAYGSPSDSNINSLATEVTYLLRDGYMLKLEVGFFQPDWKRRLTWMYVVSGTTLSSAGSPGGISSGHDISGTSFQSLIWWTPKWWTETELVRTNYYTNLTSKRSGTVTPTDGSGAWSTKTIGYSSGGQLLTRSAFTPS